MGIPLKCFVIWLAFSILFMWSAMFFLLGARLTERPLQTGAVERGYAEWVLSESPYREYPGWRWIEPEGK